MTFNKVYLPAIEGYVPPQMVRTLRALLEFIYFARRNVQDTRTLELMEDALTRFHQYRSIFVTTGVRRKNSTPPRQHALVHYVKSIHAFGSPNGLCSSITESKHIHAVKKPWRRSNHYEALGQMLLINQRLDKLAALRADFTKRGMLNGPLLTGVSGKFCLYESHTHVLTFDLEGQAQSLGEGVRTAGDGSSNYSTAKKNTSVAYDDDGTVDSPKASPSIRLAKHMTRKETCCIVRDLWLITCRKECTNRSAF
jgi:hypothetical protein